MAKRLLIGIALGAASILSLVGCGGGEQAGTPTTGSASSVGDQSNVQQIIITAKDNIFDPKAYTAQADKPIKLTVVNGGQNVHKVEVVDILPETELAPGQSRTLDVAPQKPGTHRVYCELHGDSGMEGELTIK